MTVNMEKLLRILSENEELSKKFAQLEEPDLITAAKELGIDLAKEDFASAEGEVSENELEIISGRSSCKC